jgi:flagellar protein FlaG
MSIEGVMQIAGASIVAADRSSSSAASAPASRPQHTAGAPAAGQPGTAANGASSAADVVQNLRQQLAVINRILQEGQRNLSFSIDQTTGKTVVKVVRPDGEVVRQIPSEEALAIAAHLRAGQSLTSLGVEKWS